MGRHTTVMGLRLTDITRKQLDQTAKRAGLTTPDFVRHAVNRLVDKEAERKRFLRKKLEETIHPLTRAIIQNFCDGLQLDLADIVETLLINHAAQLEAFERCDMKMPNHMQPFLCDDAGVPVKGFELFTYLSKRYLSVIAPKEKRQQLADSIDRDYDAAVYSELALKGRKKMA